ncbi:DUF2089 domain-containing protein [Myxococcota bacterium]
MMPRLPTECPGCGDPLTVTRLTCRNCEMQIEGRFDIPTVLQLGSNDLEFVVAFVRASGSLKEMARIYDQSYPTIRNRLNDIIARLEPASGDAEKERHDILDAIARGEMSVKEGARRLQEVEDE